MASKKSGGYLGLGWIISIILAIIPFTNIVLGVITRAQAGNILGVILNIILCPLFWLIDLVTIILNNRVQFLV